MRKLALSLILWPMVSFGAFPLTYWHATNAPLINPTKFWWRNITITNASDGTLMSFWYDSTGHNFHATNGSGAAEPYKTNISGVNAVYFGSNTWLQSPFNNNVISNTGYVLAGVLMTTRTNIANDRAMQSGTVGVNTLLSFSRINSAPFGVFFNEATDGPSQGKYPLVNLNHIFILNVQTNTRAYFWIDGLNYTTKSNIVGNFTDLFLGKKVGITEDSFHYVFELAGWTNSMDTNALNATGHYFTNYVGGTTWTDIP